jgi:hypothetical protein
MAVSRAEPEAADPAMIVYHREAVGAVLNAVPNAQRFQAFNRDTQLAR